MVSSHLTKIPTFFSDGDHWIKKWDIYLILFICIEQKEDLKDTQRNTQNAALNVDIF